MTSRILLVDNYDSFTFNMVQMMESPSCHLEVLVNDDERLAKLDLLKVNGVILSPGPGRPENSGHSLAVVRWALESQLPLLGVCLGMQAMVLEAGGKLRGAERILHGRTDLVDHDSKGIYRDLDSPVEVGRYHSLVMDPRYPLADWHVTAKSQDGDVMGIRHASLPAEGVQFHPESILSPKGSRLLDNFAQLVTDSQRTVKETH